MARKLEFPVADVTMVAGDVLKVVDVLFTVSIGNLDDA